jgi:serine/threonine protein kinase
VSTLAKYKIRERIARSRWSTLYSADDNINGGKIAVKVFHLKGSKADAIGSEDEGVWRKRFALEADILKAVHHKHIISVIESGALPDGRPCLLMPFAQANLTYEIGSDISDPAILAKMAPPKRPKRLKPVRALQILRQILSGLAVLHDMGVVHRDLKPDNVLLTKRSRGDVMLCDFGMAKWGDKVFDVENEYIGSRGYTSPEQRENPADAGPQSDLYSFGLIAFRLLCGRLPKNGERSVKEAGADAGTKLEGLIFDCLSVEAAERPLNASAALERLTGRGRIEA